MWEVLRTALQALAGGLGASAKESWPLSGLTVTAFVAFGVVRLSIQARRNEAQRVRACGVLAIVCGVLFTALALGWRHAGEGPKAGFIPQYTTLIAPLMGCMFLALIVYGPDRRGPLLQKLVLVAMVAVFSINARKGLICAKQWSARIEPAAIDLRAGLAPESAAMRHWSRVGAPDAPALGAWLTSLRQADPTLPRTDSTATHSSTRPHLR